MSGDNVNPVAARSPVDSEAFFQTLDHLVATGAVRHAATIRCKRTGHHGVVMVPVMPLGAPKTEITNLTVTVDAPDDDDDNIIDPYGSGPVPIEPVTVKPPSGIVDGVKTGLVVGGDVEAKPNRNRRVDLSGYCDLRGGY